MPRKVALPGEVRHFARGGVKGTISRLWFEGMGMLPVDRDDSKAALASLDTALEVLGRGEAFGLYPRAPAPATAGSTAAARASPTSR